ncbi:hypothetical protein [Streptomyces tardus]|uniref:hypothetical protein n=1 Tax=Streptomyces tardus TaxID=2780544 RepID=UPI0027E4E04E|nr:hypothetical protein [Streptomyces tardus]
MSGPGARARLRPVLLCLLAAALAAASLSCVPAVTSLLEAPSEHRMQRLLDRQAAAVREGDEAAYLETVDPLAVRYRNTERRLLRNVRRLPLSQWSYRVADVSLAEGSVGGRARAEVVAQLRYRLRGYDEGTRTATQRWTVVARDGRWYRDSTRFAETREVWEQGRLDVVTGRHSLVLGSGRPRSELRALARAADRAVPEVSALWPGRWPRRIVVLAPADLDRTAQLLSAAPAQYRGIAAVTTSENGRGRAADRIVVNPGPFGTLSAAGRQVVMTHEAAHVATREATTETTPMWLSEGLADWIGYGGTDAQLPGAAPRLRAALEEGALPERLPGDGGFAFDGPAHALALSYEAGWLGALMVAEQWGEQSLRRFYAAAGRPGPGALDRALRAELGVDEQEFHARWRQYVRHKLG